MKIIACVAALALLSACQASQVVTRAGPEPVRARVNAPPSAAPGTCWGTDVTPAAYETVTEQILIQPAEVGTDGRVRRQAVYKTETRQAIIRERREIWFETPCDAELTPDLVASLQRALAARGYYRGPISGAMNVWTRRAVRAYQAPQGLDSAILSMAAARKLGLVAVKRDDKSEPDARS